MLNFSLYFNLSSEVARPFEQLFSYLETEAQISDVDFDRVFVATFRTLYVDPHHSLSRHCFRERISSFWQEGVKHGPRFSEEAVAQLLPGCLEVRVGPEPDTNTLHAYSSTGVDSLLEGALTEVRGKNPFLVISQSMLVVDGREQWRGIAGVRPVSGYDWNGGIIGVVILGRHVR